MTSYFLNATYQGARIYGRGYAGGGFLNLDPAGPGQWFAGSNDALAIEDGVTTAEFTGIWTTDGLGGIPARATVVYRHQSPVTRMVQSASVRVRQPDGSYATVLFTPAS